MGLTLDNPGTPESVEFKTLEHLTRARDRAAKQTRHDGVADGACNYPVDDDALPGDWGWSPETCARSARLPALQV